MAKTEIRTLPPTLESFGVAIDFLARYQPFSDAQLGAFSRAVRRQILKSEHVIAWDGTHLIGYAGWLPTTLASARTWLNNTEPLKGAGAEADAVALTTVAVADKTLIPRLLREARRRNPGRRVFFKRDYANSARPARKSSVFNRGEGSSADARPDEYTAVSARSRPPIAEDPCGFLFELAGRSPGKTERVEVGSETVIVVQDAAIAHQVIAKNVDNYTKNFASFMPLLGRSRLTLDGQRWRRSQKLTQSFIAPHDVKRAEVILLQRYAQLADNLLLTANGSVALDSMIDRAAVGTIVALAFSSELDGFGETFTSDLRTVIRYATKRAWDLEGVPVAADEHEKAVAAAANNRIRDTVQAMVDRRRVAADKPPDALTSLIEAADASEDGPEDQRIDLVGEIVTLIVAGSDTTAATIGWAFSILAQIPDFQEELREEIQGAVASRGPILRVAGMVPSLGPFLDETLRMFPSVPILSRFAVEADDLAGVKVAAGERVLVSVIGLHQNPAVWDSPREFRLDRHEGGRTSRPDRRSAFMPFSAGPRICGGARFAEMELNIAIMLVLQQCRLDLVQPLPTAFEWGASMRRRGGQFVRALAL